jgi:hypothetical protein
LAGRWSGFNWLRIGTSGTMDLISYSGENVSHSCLGYDNVWPCMWVPMFWRNIMLPYSE